jgi:hypothetical protein
MPVLSCRPGLPLEPQFCFKKMLSRCRERAECSDYHVKAQEGNSKIKERNP